MVTKNDYDKNTVEAAKSVLIELLKLLDKYKDKILVVGGSVPSLLINNSEEPHIGTIDINFTLNHKNLVNSDFVKIKQILINNGFKVGRKPCTYIKNCNGIEIQIDFLYGKHPNNRVAKNKNLGIEPLYISACNLAFEIGPTKVSITDGNSKIQVPCISIATFVIMKGVALGKRQKEKDAYDIYYCLKHYPDGIDKMVKDLELYKKNETVQECVKCIPKFFDSADGKGPKWIADFEAIIDQGEREIIERNAYEKVKHFLDKLCVG
jgi:hypothetical protein